MDLRLRFCPLQVVLLFQAFPPETEHRQLLIEVDWSAHLDSASHFIGGTYLYSHNPPVSQCHRDGLCPR